MRLLNVETLQLELFEGGPKAAYAILSHTWGDGEVSFQDITLNGSVVKAKKGFSKIVGCCAKARSEGYRYVWIDTCCIDKSSSAELSEAINSMFKWYQAAEVCYVFLSDVKGVATPMDMSLSGSLSLSVSVSGLVEEQQQQQQQQQQIPKPGSDAMWELLVKSRWFTRGWTLQELLAPLEVIFYDSEWRELGTRETLSLDIYDITGIEVDVLTMDKSWTDFSVAQRLSWASARHTSRVEDEAYCLMGLFGVNMPLLYGEGQKAFKRLQLEIMRQSYDPSILAWASPDSHGVIGGVLAQSPAMFEDCGDIDWKPPFPSVGGGGGGGGGGRAATLLDNQFNSFCHDIIGSSLRMQVGVVEPPPPGGPPMVLKAFGDITNFDDSSTAVHPEGDQTAELIHFPRGLGESYAHDRAFREFDFGFLQHTGRSIALVILEGCMKHRRHTIGIVLCRDATGLMKRVHFPSRFLVPGRMLPLFTANICTLHVALSGSEVLHQQPLPNWAKCLVRFPDHLRRARLLVSRPLGEMTDYASLSLRPCFALMHKAGVSRAMAFRHRTDPSLSFLLVFTLIRPATAPLASFKSRYYSEKWIQVGLVQGLDTDGITSEKDLLPVELPAGGGSAPLRSWLFELSPTTELAVRMRKHPSFHVAILEFRAKDGGDGG
ncbi:heterokaryon incompatibility protein-domain-containing protein [Bombardia bombarda]|uniref:Heterokaryon incompatibility protein-domain-containing protein n=1 Tax=Bombardia bombarda TaxID=252184 RepID=A0AA39XMM3_9PEZI|nr:heterokaryon incompatibility protein-domain-containing protein [Bombardia bombarda]